MVRTGVGVTRRARKHKLMRNVSQQLAPLDAPRARASSTLRTPCGPRHESIATQYPRRARSFARGLNWVARDVRARGRKNEDRVGRRWARGGDGGSCLELRLSSASWVIGKAPASAQQLGMSLGCSVMGERAMSVLCGLCGQIRNLIETRLPALRSCSASLPFLTCLLSSHSNTSHHCLFDTCIRLRVPCVSVFVTSCCSLPAPARNRTAQLEARVLRIVPRLHFAHQLLISLSGRSPRSARPLCSPRPVVFAAAAPPCFSPPREAAIEVDSPLGRAPAAWS